MRRLLLIGEFAEVVGVSAATIRRLVKNGKLAPAYTSPSGYRYFSQDQAAAFFSTIAAHDKEKTAIGYCLVPNDKADQLDGQINTVRNYMAARGYRFKIISDIGSNSDINRKGFNQLLTEICQNRINRIVVLFKDRLVDSGFEILQTVANFHGCSIEIIDNSL